MLWFSLVLSRIGGLNWCGEVLTGWESDFLRVVIGFIWTLSTAQEPPPESRSVSSWPTCCVYSQCPLNVEYLITWPSKYTSGQPQASCLRMPILLYVESGKLAGSLCPIRYLGKEGGVGQFFFLSTLHSSMADSAFQRGSPTSRALQPKCISKPQGTYGKQILFPHRWKELLKSHYHIPRFWAPNAFPRTPSPSSAPR